jgi:hypothetical protein
MIDENVRVPIPSGDDLTPIDLLFLYEAGDARGMAPTVVRFVTGTQRGTQL